MLLDLAEFVSMTTTPTLILICIISAKSEFLKHVTLHNLICHHGIIKLFGASLSELHINETCVRDLFICMVCRTTVTPRCVAYTQFFVYVPKYFAQYRLHILMFACSTAQACRIHCNMFQESRRGKQQGEERPDCRDDESETGPKKHYIRKKAV